MQDWHDDDDRAAEALLRQVRRARRRWAMAMCVGLGFFAAFVLTATPLTRLLRGEVDLLGRRAYRPPHTPDADVIASIDHARLHGELFPDWVIAMAREARGHRFAGEAEAFEELMGEAGRDPNLAQLLNGLRRHVRSGALAQDPEAALYLTWAWSEYLDQVEVPYLVQGRVSGGSDGVYYSALAYATLADASVAVGQRDYRVRVGARVDGTNAREMYLGAAGRTEAIVVADRLREFAMTDIWPLLDPMLDGELADRRPFAAGVRAEAFGGLDYEAYRSLERTARARKRIVQTVAEIHGREDCGSTFVINVVPWHGFEATRIERLRGFALLSAPRECPSITAEEVEVLADASATLVGIPGLDAAVDSMVAWIAQHVAIHEARHLADAEHARGFDEPLQCRSCPADMGVVARAELSGYLASLAWSPSPVTALYQACRAIADDQRLMRGGAVTGPHALAMDLIQRRLGPVCTEGPPLQLARVGRELEREMLGRSDPIALADDFPARLRAPR